MTSRTRFLDRVQLSDELPKPEVPPDWLAPDRWQPVEGTLLDGSPVTVEGVSEQLILAARPCYFEERASFITKFSPWAKSDDERAFVDSVSHHVHIRSYFRRTASSEGKNCDIPIDAAVLYSMPGPWEESDTPHLLEIRFGDPRRLGCMPLSLLDCLKSGQNFDYKKVRSVMGQYFGFYRKNIYHPEVRSSRYIVDTMAFYAKGLWTCFAIDLTEAVKGIVTYIPHGDNTHYNVINLADPQLTYRDFDDSMVVGDFIFRLHDDVALSELLFLQILAAPGARVNCKAQSRCACMAAVMWPKIRITLMHHDRNPPEVPANSIPNVRAFISFLERTATRLGELDAFARAIYWVMANCGVRYTIDQKGNRVGVFASNEGGSISIPCPHSRHLIYFALGKYPPSVQVQEDEVDKWLFMDAHQRVRLAALFQAILQSGVALMCASFNITGEHLRDALNNTTGSKLPHSLYILLSELFSRRHVGNVTLSAGMLEIPLRTFKAHFNCDVPGAIIWGRKFSFGYPGAHCLADVDTALDGWVNAQPFKRFNPAIVENFMTTRPVEWAWPFGYSGSRLRSQVSYFGNPDRLGWHSYLGTSQYCGKKMGIMCPYGLMALNVLCQAWGLNGLHCIDHLKEGSLSVSNANVVPNSFNADLGVLNPCTEITYNWSTGHALAPALPTALLGEVGLKAFYDGRLGGVGIMGWTVFT